MNMKILSLGALRGSTASLVTAAPTPPAPPAPSGQQEEGGDTVDVVTLAEANAAIAQAAVDANARWNAVLTSDAGIKHSAMATFMLNSNPTASADSIIAHLKTLPDPAAAAPAKEPAALEPPAPALTTALNNTPKIDAGVEPTTGDDTMSAKDRDAFWSTHIAAADERSPFGDDIAPGLPRTGD